MTSVPDRTSHVMEFPVEVVLQLVEPAVLPTS